MFTRKHRGADVHASFSASSLSGLCSMAMNEPLYASIDLADAVVSLGGCTCVTKRHSLGHCALIGLYFQ